ncbi:MAG: Mur ligase family protein [Kiritimatiellia bacterium]
MGKAVVLGRGRSGRAMAALLGREGWQVTVLDGADAWPEGVAFDLCATSPGVARDHPWQRRARALGVPVVGELQLGAERWRALGGRMLAVTGSKGKSSVVKLVAEGLRGIPCGNYGKPLCEVVNDAAAGAFAGAPLPWAVVEVSSFQLETTALPADAFAAAAVLNLQADHLDRHGSLAVYHGLKLALLRMAVRAIRGDAADAALRAGRDLPARDLRLLSGSYFDNPVLRANGLCAIGLMRAAGLPDGDIGRAFRSFRPLPHRMQTVGVFGGIRYVDDSKATSLAALAAGVVMAGTRVRLIAGGLPKGDDPNSAIHPLRTRVEKVYLIGCCADQFFRAWRDAVPCEICGTLDRAVESARRDAVAGETVLLSPGAASFDQFESYGVRGDTFASLVCAGTERVGGTH